MKSATIDFDFEIQQKCRFELYHVADPSSDDLGSHDFIGSSEIFVGEMVSNSPGEDCKRELQHHTRRGNGLIHISSEEIRHLKEDLAFTLRGKGLPVMDFFSRRADPFCVLHRGAKGDLRMSESELLKQKIPVYKTEVVSQQIPVYVIRDGSGKCPRCSNRKFRIPVLRARWTVVGSLIPNLTSESFSSVLLATLPPWMPKWA